MSDREEEKRPMNSAEARSARIQRVRQQWSKKSAEQEQTNEDDDTLTGVEREKDPAWGNLQWNTDRPDASLQDASSIQDNVANRIDRDLFDHLQNLKSRETEEIDKDYDGTLDNDADAPPAKQHHHITQNKYIV